MQQKLKQYERILDVATHGIMKGKKVKGACGSATSNVAKVLNIKDVNEIVVGK